jgi:hypothetical protein
LALRKADLKAVFFLPAAGGQQASCRLRIILARVTGRLRPRGGVKARAAGSIILFYKRVKLSTFALPETLT